MLRHWPLYLSLFLLTHCRHRKRDDPQPEPPKAPLSLLPPETQTGAGTFGCLVNGQAYLTRTSIKCSGNLQGFNVLYVSADCSADGTFSGEVFSTGLLLAGILENGQSFPLVEFNKPVDMTRNQFVADANRTQCGYRGNFIKTGRVELVKFDGVRRIAAGRFAFTLYEPGGCDTLRVTNGRFDVKF